MLEQELQNLPSSLLGRSPRRQELELRWFEFEAGKKKMNNTEPNTYRETQNSGSS